MSTHVKMALALMMSRILFAQAADDETVVTGLAKPGDGSAVAKAWIAFSKKAVGEKDINGEDIYEGRLNPTYAIQLKKGTLAQQTGGQAIVFKGGQQYSVFAFTGEGDSDWIGVRESSVTETNARLLEELTYIKEELAKGKQKLTPQQEAAMVAELRADHDPQLIDSFKTAQRNTKDMKAMSAFVKAALELQAKDGDQQAERNKRICEGLTPKQLAVAKTFLGMETAADIFAGFKQDGGGGFGVRIEGDGDGGKYSYKQSRGKVTFTVETMKLKNVLEKLVRDVASIFERKINAPELAVEILEKKISCEFQVESAEKAIAQLLAAAGVESKTTDTEKKAALPLIKVESAAFKANAVIPAKHTKTGANSSPPLRFADVPAAVKELVLICDDPDAEDFVHWVVYGIPGNCAELPGGLQKSKVLDMPKGARQGKNDFDEVGYGGPMPPPGSGVHRYRFTVYAVDQATSLEGGASRTEVLKAISGHVIAKGELTGTYERR